MRQGKGRDYEEREGEEDIARGRERTSKDLKIGLVEKGIREQREGGMNYGTE